MRSITSLLIQETIRVPHLRDLPCPRCQSPRTVEVGGDYSHACAECGHLWCDTLRDAESPTQEVTT